MISNINDNNIKKVTGTKNISKTVEIDTKMISVKINTNLFIRHATNKIHHFLISTEML